MSEPSRRTGRHRHRDDGEPTSTWRLHGHGPAAQASTRVQRILLAVLVPVALATLAGVWLTWPDDEPRRSGADLGFGQRPAYGEVLETATAPCTSGAAPVVGQDEECVALLVQLTEGSSAGTAIRQVLPDEPSTPEFAPGDRVVLA